MAPRKLSDSDKSDIIELYRQPDQTTSTLASQYGVSNSTISRILKLSLPPEEYSQLISQKRMAGGADKAETAKAKPEKNKAKKQSGRKRRSRKSVKEESIAEESAASSEEASSTDSSPTAAPKLKKAPAKHRQ